jgi:hypothetical protein
MYRATATALALVSFLPRVGVGYQPVDGCCPPPCGCEAPPVVCCDPCDPSAPATRKDRPKSSGPLPTPAGADAKKPTPAESTPAELPKPALAPNADAITPQPLNTPEIEATVAAPAESPAAPVANPAAPETAPAEPAPRYADPPAAAPAVEPTRYDDIFSNTPESTEPPAAETPEPATAEPQTPAPETEPAEAPAPAESADTTPAGDLFTAPAEETPPTEETTAPAEESAPAPAEEPATETPEGDELFGPSAARDVLTQPGGWASDASRPWNDAEGQLLLTGRITEVTARFVVLSREDGQSQAVRYSHLGDEDLGFLRRQIEARRVQLASQAGGDELLAEQSR